MREPTRADLRNVVFQTALIRGFLVSLMLAHKGSFKNIAFHASPYMTFIAIYPESFRIKKTRQKCGRFVRYVNSVYVVREAVTD